MTDVASESKISLLSLQLRRNNMVLYLISSALTFCERIKIMPRRLLMLKPQGRLYFLFMRLDREL
jgi:hypothetical protein